MSNSNNNLFSKSNLESLNIQIEKLRLFSEYVQKANDLNSESNSSNQDLYKSINEFIESSITQLNCYQVMIEKFLSLQGKDKTEFLNLLKNVSLN